jgi:dihydrofolate reductase
MSQPGVPRVILVAAVAANGVIGARGGLPWRLPGDLRHFKALTLGHPVIMGRRTWEGLGRALPGRENIVVTRRPGFEAPGAHVAASLDAALALCAGEPAAFVIGGAQLYAAALPLADALELTEIHRDYDGDTRFPPFERADWREIERRPQSSDGLRFDFVRYERA